uniref:GOLD domain-containing protein n=1 Tax=Macrostomum lignano TaxID=282301 RepID=A0A1I8INI5_9PLAT
MALASKMTDQPQRAALTPALPPHPGQLKTMHWKVLIALLAVIVAYLFLGAVGFHFIEGPTEETRQADLQALTAKFMSEHSCVNPSNLTAFFTQVLDAYQAGYRLGPNGSVVAPAPKWDYPSAVFFCMTVITTIGYGNLSPSTSGGQAFCCVYALIGIPLLAILLSGIAERVKSAKERIQACECWKDKGRVPEVVTTLLYFVFGILLFIFVPAASFTALEGWTFSEGMYYSFVTLSTIGFGDYVAGQKVVSAIYKFCLSMWIYLGLVFMSGVISTVQSLIERGAKKVDAKIDASDLPSETGEEPDEAAHPASKQNVVEQQKSNDNKGDNGIELDVLLLATLPAVAQCFDQYPKRLAFELPDNEEFCFYQAFDKSESRDSFLLRFRVVRGGNNDVDFLVRSPTGEKIYSKLRARSDERAFKFMGGGAYAFCFGNEFSTVTHKVVQFALDRSRAPSLAEEAGVTPPTALTLLQSELEAVHQQLVRAEAAQTMHRAREVEGRALSDDLNRRVATFSGILAVAVLACGLGQVAALKALFGGAVRQAKISQVA